MYKIHIFCTLNGNKLLPLDFRSINKIEKISDESAKEIGSGIILFCHHHRTVAGAPKNYMYHPQKNLGCHIESFEEPFNEEAILMYKGWNIQETF